LHLTYANVYNVNESYNIRITKQSECSTGMALSYIIGLAEIDYWALARSLTCCRNPR